MLGQKLRILVVDDDVTFGNEVVHWLQDAGFDARFHAGAIGVLQAVRDYRADLVLLDIHMPRIDGSTVLRMIRDAFGLGRVRVMLCSNMESRWLGLLSRATGAPAISKAHIQDELVDRIRAMFATSGVHSKVSPARDASRRDVIRETDRPPPKQKAR